MYACTCDKLGGRAVVLKVYDKTKVSAVKHRSIRREARIMKYLTYKGCVRASSCIPLSLPVTNSAAAPLLSKHGHDRTVNLIGINHCSCLRIATWSDTAYTLFCCAAFHM